MNPLMQQLESLIITVPAVLLAISVHEFSHGYVSYKCGDPTPLRDGRLSLNPLHHLDLVGTLCLLLFHFGWARPVQINPYYYKDRKKGIILTALAGPASNFILAFICMILFRLVNLYGNDYTPTQYVALMIYYCSIVNIGLGIFNLIPIPPLDGSQVLAALVPSVNQTFRKIGRYAPIVLMVLIYLGILRKPLGFLQSGLLNGMWQVVVKLLPAKALAPTGGFL